MENTTCACQLLQLFWFVGSGPGSATAVRRSHVPGPGLEVRCPPQRRTRRAKSKGGDCCRALPGHVMAEGEACCRAGIHAAASRQGLGPVEPPCRTSSSNTSNPNNEASHSGVIEAQVALPTPPYPEDDATRALETVFASIMQAAVATRKHVSLLHRAFTHRRAY